MRIPFYGYSRVTGLLTAGLTADFSLPYLKRRNADGSFTDLASPGFVDDGDGAYSLQINDVDRTPGSFISYVIALGPNSAQAYESGHVASDSLTDNVVPFFVFSAATGAPTTGIPATIALYKRRNADGSVVDLIASAPAVTDCGNLLYLFTVDPALRPAGSAIEYVVYLTAASAAPALDGVVEDGTLSTPLPIVPLPAPAPPVQIVPAFAFTADAYADQLAQLLPPGRAFNLEHDSIVTETLKGAAQEFARVDGRAVDLLNESDPRTANETIGDWEKMLSLPDDRVLVIAATLAERQIDVTAKYTTRGGQDRKFFIDLAAACGYTVKDVPVPVPVATVGLVGSIGGHLGAGTFTYRVSALDAGGNETAASPEVAHTFISGTHNTVQVTWALVAGALRYRVYGRTAGAEQKIAELGSASTAFTDDGSIAPSGALPTGSPAALQYPAIQKFAKKILRAGFRCGDRVYGAAYAYSMLLNVQTPAGPAMAQADFERVIRHALQWHIVAAIFVYH